MKYLCRKHMQKFKSNPDHARNILTQCINKGIDFYRQGRGSESYFGCAFEIALIQCSCIESHASRYLCHHLTDSARWLVVSLIEKNAYEKAEQILMTTHNTLLDLLNNLELNHESRQTLLRLVDEFLERLSKIMIARDKAVYLKSIHLISTRATQASRQKYFH